MDERLQKYSFLENPKYGYEQTHNSWNCYWGLKLHFTTEHYDLFKYGGKTRIPKNKWISIFLNENETETGVQNELYCIELVRIYIVNLVTTVDSLIVLRSLSTNS